MHPKHVRKVFAYCLWQALFIILASCALSQASSSQVSSATAVPGVSQEQVNKTPVSKSTLEARYGKDYQPIQLAWFYKPPEDGDLQSLADNYQFSILTRMDEKQRDILSSTKPGLPILQYLLLDEIQNPGSCSAKPKHDHVAEQVGDYCLIVAKHPDWFLRDALGNIVTNKDGYQLMDPANVGWREFWLSRAKMSQEKLGWRGVFLDNVEASLDKRIQNGAVLKNYLDNSSYQAAVEDYLKYLYTNYFQPNKVPLYGNIISLNDPVVWTRYLKYLDGAMIENFAVGWDGYKSQSDWETDLVLAESAQAMGKGVILVSQGTIIDLDRQAFSLASYLLVSNGRAYFRYTNDQNYEQSWLNENYHTRLGYPLGPRYKDGSQWVRDFENGRVTVNPKTHQSSIDLNQ